MALRKNGFKKHLPFIVSDWELAENNWDRVARQAIASGKLKFAIAIEVTRRGAEKMDCDANRRKKTKVCVYRTKEGLNLYDTSLVKSVKFYKRRGDDVVRVRGKSAAN